MHPPSWVPAGFWNVSGQHLCQSCAEALSEPEWLRLASGPLCQENSISQRGAVPGWELSRAKPTLRPVNTKRSYWRKPLRVGGCLLPQQKLTDGEQLCKLESSALPWAEPWGGEQEPGPPQLHGGGQSMCPLPQATHKNREVVTKKKPRCCWAGGPRSPQSPHL